MLPDLCLPELNIWKMSNFKLSSRVGNLLSLFHRRKHFALVENSGCNYSRFFMLAGVTDNLRGCLLYTSLCEKNGIEILEKH